MGRDDMVRRIQLLFDMARDTAGYAARYDELRIRETKLEKLAANLTDEEQDIIWGFICLSEELNWCMLEMLCLRYNIDPQKEKKRH